MTDQVTGKNLAEMKATVDSLHVGDPHWADDIQNYKDIITRVEKVVAEMRDRELKVSAFESAATASQVGFWADELEGTNG